MSDDLKKIAKDKDFVNDGIQVLQILIEEGYPIEIIKNCCKKVLASSSHQRDTLFNCLNKIAEPIKSYEIQMLNNRAYAINSFYKHCAEFSDKDHETRFIKCMYEWDINLYGKDDKREIFNEYEYIKSKAAIFDEYKYIKSKTTTFDEYIKNKTNK
ncbi:hypothetical protein MNB_SUP05-5-976 [hydrothermal vent metagenome]|uniref:Uncharacterized protein n=1 Tax=hydrothermal vent metagenome TaxID=652676 RepID=A0A1W1BHP6_9ZZZZ